jgi:ribosomal protein S18 acetylase RimI-like enzyme
VTVAPATLTDLCAVALPDEALTVDELAHVCFGEGDEVIGDERGAVAFTIKRTGEHVALWILLVAIEPACQGQGIGSTLVREAMERGRSLGARTAHLANSVPRYLWPGVDVTNTRAGMLFESLGFERDLVGINMEIATSFRRDPPPGLHVERETGAGALEFAGRAFPYWVDELRVACERGTAFAARDAHGETVAFGCHSCNRAAWIGPMATDPSVQHGGIGSAVLAAVCADLEARGHATSVVAWVSNLRFYGKCGATVSGVYQGGHRAL